jgi:hypothetical protein
VDYQTDVLTDRVVETINEAALKQPFFLSIAPKALHTEERVASSPNLRLIAWASSPCRAAGRPFSTRQLFRVKPDFARNLLRVTKGEAWVVAALPFRARLATRRA